jgi:heme-degrading monooxygenase HmoA
MSALLIRHKVADYAIWRRAFDAHGANRRANGSRGGQLFRSTADPNETIILLEWDDLTRARLFAQSDDLREAMARAGVVDEPDLWVLDETSWLPD